MATARHSPVGFVEIAGNGLDAFDTEVVAPPPEIVAPPPVPAGPPMLEIVAAYPEADACPEAWRSTAGRRVTLRRLVLGTFNLARTIALFPLVVLSWILLRIWWVLRLAVTSVWRLVTGTVWLVGYVITAIGRGIRDAANGATRLVVGAVTATARGVLGVFANIGTRITTAAAAVALGTRQAVAGAGRGLARVAAMCGSAAAASGRWAIGTLNTAVAFLARATARLDRGTRNAVIGATRATDAAGRALVGTTQRTVDGIGRGLARSTTASTTAAVVIGQKVLAAAKTTGTRVLDTGTTRARRVIASCTAASRVAGEAAKRDAGRASMVIAAAIRRSIATAARNGHTLVVGTTRAATAASLAARGAASATVVAGTRVTRSVHVSSAAALQRAERPKLRMAVADMPVWVRPMGPVPALTIALAATAAISVGVATLLVSARQIARVEKPTAAESAQESAAPSVVLAVAPATRAAAPVKPAVARRATQRPTVTAKGTGRTPAVVPAKVARAPEKAPATPRGALSAAKVRDIWSKTDTRSLDRALASLRSATLAFQRCEMRRTSDDMAVAHCDEVPARVAWTIDFRRDDGRWLIDGLASERRVQP